MHIDINRVMDKLDDYFSRNDYMGALRHLNYWHDEAAAAKDDRALFFILNELIGWHRKQGNENEAIKYSEKTLMKAEQMGITDTPAGATAMLNAATAYKAFGRAEKALPLYKNTEKIYEKNLSPDDTRIAGLYNNLALALTDLKDFEGAKTYYKKAIEIMLKNENGQPDAAISYLNLADTVEHEKGIIEAEKEISEYIEKAKELLDTKKASSDGYYAFVCEKCAPVFGYYGYFLYESEIKERAVKIYERA